PWLKGELVYEYDFKISRDNLDEAIIAFETAGFEVELGRLYAPFGEYFSHFASGPLLDFGETRRPGAIVSYRPSEQLDLSVFALKSRAARTGSRGSAVDWGLALEASPFEFGTFGLSYLSDLAESDKRLLADSDDRYEKRVDGLSAYASVGHEQFEFTAELVQALGSFRELESDRNKPRAWNAELAFFPSDNLSLAIRLEGSRELEDAPDRQAGVALTWQLLDKVFLTAEALRGTFKRGLAEDARGREIETVTQIGGQISVDL
ncbi:MAG: LbtU family siderophore porin, partial [Nevskiales bacterium]